MVALKNRWLALAALVMCVLVIGLDGTVLNVALATLAADLGASTGELQWIVSSYLITFSAFLLPAGLAGDRWGRKKLLLAGLVIFGAASGFAAFAGSTATLVAARAVMGVGAAIIIPLSMSTLPVIFPPEERARAISTWTVGMGLALPLGPIVGGWLLENYWWGSVFLINLPVIAIALIAAAILLPESKDPASAKLDPLSVVLSVSGLGLAVYGVIDAPEAGWGSARVLGSLGAATVLIGLFIYRNLRRREPMVDLGLFRSPAFTWGTVATVFAALALMGGLFVVPLYLQAVKGFSAMQTGWGLVPLILGLMVTGKLAPRIAARLGNRSAIVTGMLLLAAGFALGSLTTTASPFVLTGSWLGLAGLGLGLAMVPAMDTVLASLPEAKAGAGSGLVQTLRQVAGAFAVAGLGSLLNSIYSNGLSGPAKESIVAAARLGDPAVLFQAQANFVSGMDVVLIVCAIGSVAGAALVAAFFKARPAPVG
ncbi:DHA2 family efflux MFS transporter permease subunit [Catelliglobosispora koreensis]|uniref:DHA2 family efflux MFS transporter permease subunit n=1 Tax=Catelliglobosispora koreensis TaxID=129052 RepID=UPI0003726959|nr:DHA2 family efflux MFS transporter permease subunit [Catelliglobosispora koreensis]